MTASSAPSVTVVTAGLLVIGDEILSGRTKDKNIGYIAEYLTAIGVDLREVRVVPDMEDEIVAALNALRHKYTYVFTTGGIGPTHDDITVDCVAKALGRKVVEHPEARRILEDHYDEAINEARLRMARAPEGAELLENPISAAPGLHIENVFVLAGIPEIMRAQFESAAPLIHGGQPLQSVSLPVAMAESVIAPGLGALQERYPDVEMGSYPYQRAGRFGTVLVLRSSEGARLAAAAAELRQLIAELGGRIEEETS